jgi:hypothetical protein
LKKSFEQEKVQETDSDEEEKIEEPQPVITPSSLL